MTDLPTFDEFVDVLRKRLAAHDALNPSALHDFRERGPTRGLVIGVA
jgi:hypothetical protein